MPDPNTNDDSNDTFPILIHPPLLNSSNPWATTHDDLRALYDCPYTGAVTTRTSLLDGFNHDPQIHQYTFFSASSISSPATDTTSTLSQSHAPDASLNTLGYSPIPLPEYLSIITSIVAKPPSYYPSTTPNTTPRPKKPFIISITGPPSSLPKAHSLVTAAALQTAHPLHIELNLSCPNIPNSPPPAYSRAALGTYLRALQQAQQATEYQYPGEGRRVCWGIKVPPYTWAGGFEGVIGALEDVCGDELEGNSDAECPVAFITAVNTLGACLLPGFPELPSLLSSSSSLPEGTGVGTAAFTTGGMAGAPLHPLALGNVATLHRMLSKHGNPQLRRIRIIGIGGVSDAAGCQRMKGVGAWCVGVGTALGIHGIDVFKHISSH